VGVQIQVRYFAAARELASCESELVTLPDAEVSSADLLELLALRHPRLAPYLSRLRLAINDELRCDAPPVRAGDVIDIMPPVAGGAPAQDATAWIELADARGRVALRTTALSVDEVMAVVSHPSAGGIALFAGAVRDHAAGRAVDRLDYEAHDTLAARELAGVANEVLAAHPEVRVCAVHRVGSLAIGDLAVVVAASAPHRAEAFDACRMLIEQIKARVPIWKKEWAADGTADWVNLTR
jgi:molybdopterin synthase catalytic subunit/molybdopterin converting factor small subunit